MDYIGDYEECVFPKERQIIVDIFDMAVKKHYVSALAEVDVTEGHKIISSEPDEHRLSFTGWIARCVAEAVSENKFMHALRRGKKKLVIFDDVDISIVVETNSKSLLLPKPLIVRRAQTKTVREITNEIRLAQNQDVTNGWEMLGEGSGKRIAQLARVFPSLPKIFRLLVYRKWRDPFFIKKNLGTVLISSVGMFTKMACWGISAATHPLVFILGGIGRRPCVVDNDRIEIREMLSVTMLFNHDTVDGAPAARFGQRLAELVQSAFGLK